MTPSNEPNPNDRLANVGDGTGPTETDQPDSPQPDAEPTQREAQSDPTESSPEKDPADWVTGDEPATGPQLSYLGTLAQQAGEQVPDNLTKARASQLIDELQARTGRGSGSNA